MPTGSSTCFMMEKFPERSFDVGISEEHAVTFAAGLAKEGLQPFAVSIRLFSKEDSTKSFTMSPYKTYR